MLTSYQQLIHKTRYARENETWEDTVLRYIDYMKFKLKNIVLDYEEIKEAILNMDVMPSMRLLRTAGDACEFDNTASYNCSYIVIDSPMAFAESMHNLMCGTGVGFSLEQVSLLPFIPRLTHVGITLCVEDSKEGWSRALEQLLTYLYIGKIPRIDYSKIRPCGSKLKTFGGYASGAFPLASLFEFVINTFINSQTRQLTEIEVHDIMCKIASIIQCGGVRRSAEISLSQNNLNIKRDSLDNLSTLRHLANNSIIFNKFPSSFEFYKYWNTLIENKNGEPGFFNRATARLKRADANEYCGVNPCGEAILNSREFCNLTEVIGREWDNEKTIANKLRIAAILGTYQASLTNFKFLSSRWKENCEKSRLLGVSISGVCDSDFLLNATPNQLLNMRTVVYNTNLATSKLLGIKQASSYTCIKPSGTVSQLVDCSFGIHPRFSEYYIRRVYGNVIEPIYREIAQNNANIKHSKNDPEIIILEFPMRSTRYISIDYKQLLNLVLKYNKYYATHAVSATIYVPDNKWLEVGDFVFNNLHDIVGLTFFPTSDYKFTDAPYEKITKAEYESLEKPNYIINNNIECNNTYEYECSSESCKI